jgi:ribosomal protein S18 acetylase RimI-like enzyme
MRVRAASAGDVDALARLNAEVQELHRAARPDRYRDAPLAEIADWMRQLLADPAVTVLVAEDGEAIGFAVVRRSDSPGHTFAFPRLSATVEALGVTANAQRRGAGRALMAAAEELARSWGAASVVLDVQSFNQAALDFYRALGYAPATTRMSKRL